LVLHVVVVGQIWQFKIEKQLVLSKMWKMEWNLAVFFVLVVLQSVVSFQVRSIYGSLGKRWISSPSALGLSTSDFKNGMTFELDGTPVRLIEFLHVKPGKGAAFVRSKVKNLMNGNIIEKTFRAGESIVAAAVSKTQMQYTYVDGNTYCFMNMETFEEQRIPKDLIPNPLLLVEGLSCTVTIWNDRVIEVALPQSVIYTVAECPPNFKGNTAQGAQKPATLNSGAVVQVPMFINAGEKILVSTDDVKYLGRA
jgi:elongation factor P